MNKMNFLLKGLTCEACAKLVKRRVGTINGVTDAVVSLDGKMEVSADREIAKREISDVLSGTDYGVI